jgi:hypothetical protein
MTPEGEAVPKSAGIAMGPREFTYMCEKWGFVKSRNSSNGHQIMEHPGGSQITLRKAGAINDDTLSQAASICGVSANEFLEGPKQEQKTTKRRKVGSAKTAVLDLLIEQGDYISETGSAINDLAVLLDLPVQNVGYNVGKMIDRGEIVVDRRGMKRRIYKISLKPKNMPSEIPVKDIVEEVSEVMTTVFENVDAQHVANLLFNRVIDIVMSGSSERHERIVTELQERLAEQIEYGNVAREKLRESQEEQVELRTRVRELTEQVSRMKDQMSKMDKAKPLTREVKNELAALNARRK